MKQEESDETYDGGDGSSDNDEKDGDDMETSLDQSLSNLGKYNYHTDILECHSCSSFPTRAATGLSVYPVAILYSGDTVTIQVVAYMKLHIGCHTGRCGAQSCPGLYFDPIEYSRCTGEVFQIYRAAGLGPVRSGEDVGFYFPARRAWLRGWPQTDLGRCPGLPRNSHYHLNTGCWGEVFKLRARGKRHGQPIDILDHVMIYYPRSRAYLRYRYPYANVNGLVRGTCPGPHFPTSQRSYEKCPGYVFRIHKQM